MQSSNDDINTRHWLILYHNYLIIHFPTKIFSQINYTIVLVVADLGGGGFKLFNY